MARPVDEIAGLGAASRAVPDVRFEPTIWNRLVFTAADDNRGRREVRQIAEGAG